MASTSIRERIRGTASENEHKVGKSVLPSTRQPRGALGDIANRAQISHRTVKGTLTSKTQSYVTVVPKAHTSAVKKVNSESASQPKASGPVSRESGATTQLESYIIEAPVRPADVRDIDSACADNPQLVSEYINEIYVYLRQLERAQSIKPNYMEGYTITSRMRTILMDWLVQVHQRFHLLQETLYLTVAIIDRFLQFEEVSKNKLQLVGVTAMWIASKYEEMYAPEIADFVYITDDTYTKSTIRQMERIMLNRLDFNLGRPLPLHFLRRYSKAADVDSMKHTLAKYLLELSILDYHLVHVNPSEVSAASLCLSIKLLDADCEEEEDWDSTAQFYSTYTEQQLEPTMCRLALLVWKSSSSKQQAVRLKYQHAKFMKISLIEELQSSIIEDYAQRAVETGS